MPIATLADAPGPSGAYSRPAAAGFAAKPSPKPRRRRGRSPSRPCRRSPSA